MNFCGGKSMASFAMHGVKNHCIQNCIVLTMSSTEGLQHEHELQP